MVAVSQQLDQELAASGLTNDNLVLAGFSQGSSLAAYVALERNVLGVMPFGYPCPPRASLERHDRVMLPESSTRVCVVIGDRDMFAPEAETCASFAKYKKVDEQTDGVHVVAGMAHVVQQDHADLGYAFLKSCGFE